jgi:hypothetical protein
VPDEIEGKWMKQIYELRAIGIPDSEIVTEMNLIGFKTRIKRRLNEQKG